MKKAKIIWDFDRSPDEKELIEVLADFGVVAKFADTRSDDFCLVLSDSPISQEEADKYYWEERV